MSHGNNGNNNNIKESMSSTPTSTTTSDKCPIDHDSRQAWSGLASGPLYNPHTRTKITNNAKLSTEREVSTIPRALDGDAEGDEGGRWVYPSEQQFYSALLRKHHGGTGSASHPQSFSDYGEQSSTAVEVKDDGHAVTNGHVVKVPEKRDMRVVVPIHNAVNEQTWSRVLEWEDKRTVPADCPGPRLVSFKGDSRKISPRARWRILLGYQRPFDRHDWIVERCGTRIRYVIDYYTGSSSSSTSSSFNGGVPRQGQLSFYIDARPALDSWEGIKMRFSRTIGRWFSF